MTDATPLASEQITQPLNKQHPEAYNLMLGFYCNPTYYNSDPKCRPADNVLMAIQYALDRRASLSATSAPSDQEKNEAWHMAQHDAAHADADAIGVGYTVDGAHVDPRRVSVFRPMSFFETQATPSDQDASQAQGEVERLAQDAERLAAESTSRIDAAELRGFATGLRRAAALSPAPGATAQDGVERAALDQNDAMRQELSHIGNLVSDLARVMKVDQANDDGSWPNLAGRIQRLITVAQAPTPTIPAGMVAEGYSVEVVRDMDVPRGAFDFIDAVAAKADGPHRRIETPQDAQVIVFWHNERPAAFVLNLRDQFNHSIQFRATTPLAAAPKQAERQGVEREAQDIETAPKDRRILGLFADNASTWWEVVQWHRSITHEDGGWWVRNSMPCEPFMWCELPPSSEPNRHSLVKRRGRALNAEEKTRLNPEVSAEGLRRVEQLERAALNAPTGAVEKERGA